MTFNNKCIDPRPRPGSSERNSFSSPSSLRTQWPFSTSQIIHQFTFGTLADILVGIVVSSLDFNGLQSEFVNNLLYGVPEQ